MCISLFRDWVGLDAVAVAVGAKASLFLVHGLASKEGN